MPVGATVSQQCPPGVPTPVLDALGDAWSADTVTEQHRLPAVRAGTSGVCLMPCHCWTCCLLLTRLGDQQCLWCIHIVPVQGADARLPLSAACCTITAQLLARAAGPSNGGFTAGSTLRQSCSDTGMPNQRNWQGSLRNLKRPNLACRGGSRWEKAAACSCLVHATCPGWIAHSSWRLLPGSTQVTGLTILLRQRPIAQACILRGRSWNLVLMHACLWQPLLARLTASLAACTVCITCSPAISLMHKSSWSCICRRLLGT